MSFMYLLSIYCIIVCFVYRKKMEKSQIFLKKFTHVMEYFAAVEKNEFDLCILYWPNKDIYDVLIVQWQKAICWVIDTKFLIKKWKIYGCINN